MLIDLHIHTKPLSHDSLLTADDAVILAKERRLDAICLTEHDFFWDPAEVAAISRKHDFPVFPGVELNTEDGHFVVFGLREWVYGMHRTSELAELVQSEGGVILAAHPYRRQLPFELLKDGDWTDAMARAAANPAYDHVAAMESHNGRGSERENAFSQELCERLGLPRIAASDSHEPKDVGVCATDFSSNVSSVEELIAELKSGRFEPTVMHSSERSVK